MDAAPKKVIYVRHSQAQHNLEFSRGRREEGQACHDARLTDKGKQDALALGKEVGSPDVELVVTSPLTRALQTATQAFGLHSAPIQVCSLCTEKVTHPKVLADQGRHPSVLATEFPTVQGLEELPEKWWPDPGADGETLESVHRRGQLFLEWLARRPEKVIVVVTHGAFVKELTGVLLKNCGTTTFWLMPEASVISAPLPGHFGRFIHYAWASYGGKAGSLYDLCRCQSMLSPSDPTVVESTMITGLANQVGASKDWVSGETIVRLPNPEQTAPNGRVTFACAARPADGSSADVSIVHIDVHPDGRVTYVGSSQGSGRGHVSLSGITFCRGKLRSLYTPPGLTDAGLATGTAPCGFGLNVTDSATRLGILQGIVQASKPLRPDDVIARVGDGINCCGRTSFLAMASGHQTVRVDVHPDGRVVYAGPSTSSSTSTSPITWISLAGLLVPMIKGAVPPGAAFHSSRLTCGRGYGPYVEGGRALGPQALLCANGRVALMGTVEKREGVSWHKGDTVCVLDPCLRPSARSVFRVVGQGNQAARLDVLSDGRVLFVGSEAPRGTGKDSGWLSLSGISYASANGGSPHAPGAWEWVFEPTLYSDVSPLFSAPSSVSTSPAPPSIPLDSRDRAGSGSGSGCGGCGVGAGDDDGAPPRKPSRSSSASGRTYADALSISAASASDRDTGDSPPKDLTDTMASLASSAPSAIPFRVPIGSRLHSFAAAAAGGTPPSGTGGGGGGPVPPLGCGAGAGGPSDDGGVYGPSVSPKSTPPRPTDVSVRPAEWSDTSPSRKGMGFDPMSVLESCVSSPNHPPPRGVPAKPPTLGQPVRVFPTHGPPVQPPSSTTTSGRRTYSWPDESGPPLSSSAPAAPGMMSSAGPPPTSAALSTGGGSTVPLFLGFGTSPPMGPMSTPSSMSMWSTASVGSASDHDSGRTSPWGQQSTGTAPASLPGGASATGTTPSTSMSTSTGGGGGSGGGGGGDGGYAASLWGATAWGPMSSGWNSGDVRPSGGGVTPPTTLRTVVPPSAAASAKPHHQHPHPSPIGSQPPLPPAPPVTSSGGPGSGLSALLPPPAIPLSMPVSMGMSSSLFRSPEATKHHPHSHALHHSFRHQHQQQQQQQQQLFHHPQQPPSFAVVARQGTTGRTVAAPPGLPSPGTSALFPSSAGPHLAASPVVTTATTAPASGIVSGGIGGGMGIGSGGRFGMSPSLTPSHVDGGSPPSSLSATVAPFHPRFNAR